MTVGTDRRRKSRAKVLIVDDDCDERRALAGRLRRSGYDVADAGDAVQAFIVACTDAPDIAVLGSSFTRRDGLSTLDRYAHLAPLKCMPVVVLTTDARIKKPRVLDVAALLHDPADLDQLVQMIEVALDGPAPHSTGSLPSRGR